jgi:TonB family protein
MKNKNCFVSASGPIASVVTSLILLPGLLNTARGAEEPSVSQPLQVAAPEAVEVEVFKGARILTMPSSNAYPSEEEKSGREGWVELNMMIDPKGKPYEVMVADSSGSRAFEKAAVKWLQEMSFEPARRGETPIDSSYMLKMKFAIRDLAKGASEEFVSVYRSFSKAVQAGDRVKADVLFGRLHAENLYESSFENFGKFFYHKQWGTPADQLRDLRLAIAGERRPEYLPKDAFTTALYAMFGLEAAASDFGSALATWRILEPIASPQMRAALQPAVDQIHAIALGGQSVSVSAKIDDSSAWMGALFRNRFSIAVKGGVVSEIKLRCERQYLFFRYEPGIQYSIGSKKDQCGIQVIGNPGTTFDLVQ